MYRLLLLFQLLFLNFTFLAIALPDLKDDPVYRPISSRSYEAAFGIKRRAEEMFSDLEPKTQAELVYGRQGEDDKLLLANMKLYASNGMNIVLMERFDHLTRSVDCSGLDGLMSLSFRSRDAFSRALGAWKFINDEEDTNFLLIANHEDCSSADKRQPYIISKVREDSSTLTTFLTARAAPWSDVASDFDMEFGHAMPKKRSLAYRGFGSLFRSRSLDFDKGATARIDVGTPGQVFTIVSGGPSSKNNKIECVDCYMVGNLLVNGHIKIRRWYLEAFSLDAALQDFATSMVFEVTIDKPTAIDFLSYEKKLVNIPVPAAGIVVEDVFELGLRVQYTAGWTTKLKDGAVFKIGTRAKIPGTGKITVDAVDHSKSVASGFEDASVDPVFELVSLSKNTLDFSVATKPKLVFGVDIVKIGHLDLTLPFNLPELKATFTPTYGPEGACSKEVGASKTGVKIQTKIDLELDLKIDGKLFDADQSSQLWESKLWNKDHDFFKKCFPVPIMGFVEKKPVPKTPGSLPPKQKPVPSGTVNEPHPAGGMPLAPSGGFRSPIPLKSPLPSGAVHAPLSPPRVPLPSGAVQNPAHKNPSLQPEGPVSKPKAPVPKPKAPIPKPKAPIPKPKQPVAKPHAPGAKLYPTGGSPSAPSPTSGFGFVKREPHPVPEGRWKLYGII